MIQKIKRILAILIAISFVVTFTATAVSAALTVPTFNKPTIPTFTGHTTIQPNPNPQPKIDSLIPSPQPVPINGGTQDDGFIHAGDVVTAYGL